MLGARHPSQRFSAAAHVCSAGPPFLCWPGSLFSFSCLRSYSGWQISDVCSELAPPAAPLMRREINLSTPTPKPDLCHQETADLREELIAEVIEEADRRSTRCKPQKGRLACSLSLCRMGCPQGRPPVVPRTESLFWADLLPFRRPEQDVIVCASARCLPSVPPGAKASFCPPLQAPWRMQKRSGP